MSDGSGAHDQLAETHNDTSLLAHHRVVPAPGCTTMDVVLGAGSVLGSTKGLSLPATYVAPVCSRSATAVPAPVLGLADSAAAQAGNEAAAAAACARACKLTTASCCV